MKSGSPPKPLGAVACGRLQSDKAFMRSGERQDWEWVAEDRGNTSVVWSNVSQCPGILKTFNCPKSRFSHLFVDCNTESCTAFLKRVSLP